MAYACRSAILFHCFYEFLLLLRCPFSRLFHLDEYCPSVRAPNAEQVGKALRKTCAEKSAVPGISAAHIAAEHHRIRGQGGTYLILYLMLRQSAALFSLPDNMPSLACSRAFWHKAAAPCSFCSCQGRSNLCGSPLSFQAQLPPALSPCVL